MGREEGGNLLHPRGKPVGVGEGQTPAPLRRG